MKRIFFFLSFAIAAATMSAQNILGFNFGMTLDEASEVEVDCDSVVVDEETNTFLFLNVEYKGNDYDLLVVLFDDEGKLSTISLGTEVSNLEEGAALQKKIIGNSMVIDSFDDPDMSGARLYYVDDTGDDNPEYILSIVSDDDDGTLSVVATYPRDWE
ncbi:MAG: hypothetical protein SOZ80_07050 [Prevotella sp.]|uniref:hypothetical protein n=1 Tax=Prevotella sp. TaxID=59823 RepID=UPI002A2D5771|nr:hypothetical protein [Prevotella sp.]MDD7317643.1 hypothetical protein [Prevotellaceae bacterium]MDY4020510.1 hypothetical protein [Prevotella sp.]